MHRLLVVILMTTIVQLPLTVGLIMNIAPLVFLGAAFLICVVFGLFYYFIWKTKDGYL
jgi:hypothetical protein